MEENYLASSDLEGYREARAADWGGRAVRGPGLDSFEIEGIINGVMNAVGSDEQRARVGTRLGGACCILILMLMSIGTLLPLEYGLTVNCISRQVNAESVYHGGRHLIGPWNSFIPFPSTVVTVTFVKGRSGNGPLATRTKDGLSLTLQLAFQYKMEKDRLGDLYKLANLQYEPLFVRTAKEVLLRAAADYEASEYWQEREKIGIEMQDLLQKRLLSVYATCTGLQLLVIELPTEFEESIVQTQVQQQQVKTKMNVQQASRIEADTTVLEAKYAQNVTVTRTGADALYDQETRIAAAVANQRMVEVEANVMDHIQGTLGLMPFQMVAYQQFAAYYTLQNASFIYGLDNAMLQIPTAR